MIPSATASSLPSSLRASRAGKSPTPWTFGYVEVEPEVRRNTVAALEVFRSPWCEVEEVDLGWTMAIEDDTLHWYNAMNFIRQTIWHRKTSAHLMTDYALKICSRRRAPHHD